MAMPRVVLFLRLTISYDAADDAKRQIRLVSALLFETSVSAFVIPTHACLPFAPVPVQVNIVSGLPASSAAWLPPPQKRVPEVYRALYTAL